MVTSNKTPGSNGLQTVESLPKTNALVWVLATCLILGHLAVERHSFAAGPKGGRPGDHDIEDGFGGGGPKGKPPGVPGRQTQLPPPHSSEEGCHVSPGRLAEFANGEAYDYTSMVAYLVSPGCNSVSRQMGLAAIASGVTFSNKQPWRLDNYAKGIPRNDLESGKRIEESIARATPGLLRDNPLSANEMLPILGQLSILSPPAGQMALVSIIKQEIFAGDARLQQAGARGRDLASLDLAKTLVRLGATEGVIASRIAEDIEDDALLVQAESLVKFFRGLSAAASVEPALVPTFNLSAGAFNRGLQRGKPLYASAERAALMNSVFQAVKASMSGSGALEPGAAELNEGLAALMGDQPFSQSVLKRFWREAVKILAQSPSQSAMADAVAVSLTPQVMFLLPDDMEQMLLSARNYPQIAGSMQANFLLAWQRMWTDLQEGRIKIKTFNRMKERYFEPLVGELLDLDPYMIDSYWLKEVIRRGLVQDEDIEKRFPRFVLAFLDRREKATKIAAAEPGPEPVISAMAENFAVLWTLNNVHVPALMKWVRKYEQ